MSTKNQETLADYVKRIRHEKDLSTLDVESRSKRGGAKGISNGYISQIENQYIKNVSPEKLKALAIGLGVTEEEIFAIARGTSPNERKITDERFVFIIENYGFLSDMEKKSLEPLLAAIELTIKNSENFQTATTQGSFSKSTKINEARTDIDLLTAAQNNEEQFTGDDVIEIEDRPLFSRAIRDDEDVKDKPPRINRFIVPEQENRKSD